MIEVTVHGKTYQLQTLEEACMSVANAGLSALKFRITSLWSLQYLRIPGRTEVFVCSDDVQEWIYNNI